VPLGRRAHRSPANLSGLRRPRRLNHTSILAGVAAPVGFEAEEGRNMSYGNFPMVPPPRHQYPNQKSWIG
jgi:hypothetical protein